ncbi:MAG: YCF48-related protein [Candidatus Binatia bacterium]
MTPRHRRLFVLATAWCALSAPARGELQPVPRAEIRQNLFSACFASDHEGWIVGELGRIYHTTDGGKTFTRSEAGTRAAFSAVACLSDGSVVVVGQKGIALRSSDQGKSWQKLDTGSKRDLLSVDFATPQVGVAVGDFGTMLRTDDGGKTWKKIPLPADLVLPEDVAEIVQPGDVLIYDVDFADAQHGWAVGEFGVVLATTDGGQTWTAQKSPVETTLFGVQFTDANTGVATGIEQVMLRTTDGGQHWEKVRVPGRKGFVLALFDVAIQGKVGWAIGDSGLLLRTTDGGATWQMVDLPIKLAGNWFRGIALTPGTNGIIVGSEGVMLSTEGDHYNELAGS